LKIKIKWDNKKKIWAIRWLWFQTWFNPEKDGSWEELTAKLLFLFPTGDSKHWTDNRGCSASNSIADNRTRPAQTGNTKAQKKNARRSRGRGRESLRQSFNHQQAS